MINTYNILKPQIKSSRELKKILINEISTNIKEFELDIADYNLYDVERGYDIVKHNLISERRNLKENRTTIKLISKYYNDNSLVIHDNKMKENFKKIELFKKLSKTNIQTEFLKNGKYYIFKKK